MPSLHISVGRVEEGDVEIERALHRGDLHLIIAVAEVGGSTAGTEADGRDHRPACTEAAHFHQSARMPAFWITGVQRATSALTQSRSSSGEEGVAATPCLRNISWVAGTGRISVTTPFNFATIAAGVFAGANRPNQSFASMPPMPAST